MAKRFFAVSQQTVKNWLTANFWIPVVEEEGTLNYHNLHDPFVSLEDVDSSYHVDLDVFVLGVFI